MNLETWTDLQLVLLIVATFTGAVQLFLLLAMALRGGTVTVWWGIVATACTIALVFLR